RRHTSSNRDWSSDVCSSDLSILYCMAKSPEQVFSREQLYNAAWEESYEFGTNTVDNTIWRLRQKLEPNPKPPIYIKTVFRVGYRSEEQRVGKECSRQSWRSK